MHDFSYMRVTKCITEDLLELGSIKVFKEHVFDVGVIRAGGHRLGSQLQERATILV
jgi:hypothetical protein